jgi:hypothetical protein
LRLGVTVCEFGATWWSCFPPCEFGWMILATEEGGSRSAALSDDDWTKTTRGFWTLMSGCRADLLAIFHKFPLCRRHKLIRITLIGLGDEGASRRNSLILEILSLPGPTHALLRLLMKYTSAVACGCYPSQYIRPYKLMYISSRPSPEERKLTIGWPAFSGSVPHGCLMSICLAGLSTLHKTTSRDGHVGLTLFIQSCSIRYHHGHRENYFGGTS